MSNGFFDSAEGDWFLSNLNDNDATNRCSPSVLSIFNQHHSGKQVDWFFNRVKQCIYMCGACGEKIQEEDLTNHHSSLHNEVPFIMDMYELFEIDEQFRCLYCNAETIESDFQSHLKEFHPEVMAIRKNDDVNRNISPGQRSANNSDSSEQSTSTYSIYNYYTCKACTATGMKENTLKKHRLKIHPNIPQSTNLFELTKVVRKKKCDICGKLVKVEKMEKHRQQYHPDRCQPNTSDTPQTHDPPEGFHYVCVSTNELVRLQSRNRIYETEGRLHLKDSS